MKVAGDGISLLMRAYAFASARVQRGYLGEPAFVTHLFTGGRSAGGAINSAKIFVPEMKFLLNGFQAGMNEAAESERERNISSLCAPLDCHIVLNDGGGKTLPVCLYLRCCTTACCRCVTFFISIEERYF